MALGDLAYRANDLVEAEEAFRAAHALSPSDDRAAYNLGTALLARGRNEEAIEVLRPLAERTSRTTKRSSISPRPTAPPGPPGGAAICCRSLSRGALRFRERSSRWA